MGLTKVAITRPVFILMLMLASVLIGVLSYQSMTKELNPDVSFGIVSVLTTYNGASPDEVNTLVTKKIEDGVAGVEGIRQISSTSQQGRSIVTIAFNLNRDIDQAVNDVRSKVDTVLPQLPTEVDKPVVSKVDTSSAPVLYYAFTATGANSKDLRDLIDQKIKDQFSQVSGVGEVDVQGGDVREIQVQLDRSKMLAYGVSINDIQTSLANATQNVPAGHFTTDKQQFNVRVFGEFQTVDDIKNSYVAINDPNNPQGKSASIQLKDIANVVDTVQERTQYSRVNGKEAILVIIQKSKDGNTVDVVDGCQALVSKLQTQYKSIGLNVVTTLNQATQIQDSLSDLNFALIFGIFLVAAIVFLFLHNIRGTFIVSIAIPICIFVTFILLKITGFTINNLSMLALSLSIGVLVDDAIVILENIYRHLQLGEDPREAALNGRAELGLAAIAITFADVVVFGPIGFSGGVVGEFLRPLAFGYVYATITSLFVSFTVTPMLAARWYRTGENLEEPTGRFSSAFERGFDRLKIGYGRVLEWALNHRWFTFVLGNIFLVAVFMAIGGSFAPNMAAAIKTGMMPMIVAGVIGGIGTIFNLFFKRFKPLLPVYGLLFGLLFPIASVIGFEARTWKKQDIFTFQFFPANDNGQLSVNVELPPDANLNDTTAVVKEIEKRLDGFSDIKFMNVSVGTQGVGNFSVGNQGPNYALFTIALYDQQAFLDRIKFWQKPTEHIRQLSTSADSSLILQQIGKVPGATIKVAASDAFGQGSAIQLGFISQNRNLLVQTVSKVEARLRTGVIPGLLNLDLSSKPGTPELRVVPDRARLSDSGLSVAQLGSALRVLYQGDDTVKYRENGEEYVVRTMMSLKDRNDPSILSDVPLNFKQGNPIFVPSIGNIEKQSQLSKIDRLDRQEEIQVNADLLPSYSTQAGSIQAQINALLTKEKLVPEGVTYRPLGQADVQNREGGGIFVAFALGLVLVYMLLASLFDNLLYPLVIQIAQPQAFVGALIALMVADQPLNLIGIIGLVALTGLVGKNAILLVDYTNTLRERGMSRHDALVLAGPTRLRPIAMTTSALVLGMLPVALAIGRGSEFRETIGTVIIGGTLLSTLLTLVVIPCSYTIFDDFAILISKVIKLVMGYFLPEDSLRNKSALAVDDPNNLLNRPESDGTLPNDPDGSDDPNRVIPPKLG